MPPPYPTFDDDDFTTDSNTVMTKEYEANKEALRMRKLELDRQLKALEISAASGGGSAGGGGTGGGGTGGGTSADSRDLGDNKSSTQHPQYRPPPMPPQIYYGGPGVPGYPPYPPLPHHAPHMYPGGPGPGSATGSERDVTPNGPHHPPPPFNMYDPHYFAAAAAAHHHPPGPPLPSHGSDPSQDKYLLKLLQEKEEELKSVRRTLEETQTRLQEQTLQAARLQATLDQVQSSFQQERQLIQLQAEKRAQEQFQAQQQEIFQKQLDLMDKWQRGGGGDMSAGTAPLSSGSAEAAAASAPPPPVSDLPPAPETPTSSPAIAASSVKHYKQDAASAGTAETGKSDKKYPWKNKSAGAETKPAAATVADSAAAYGTERDDKDDGGTSNGNFQHSMDDSLFDSAGVLQRSEYDDEEDEKDEILATPAMAEAAQQDNEMKDSARQVTTSAGANRTMAGATNGEPQKASDRFTPVYIEQGDKAAAAEYTQFIMNNPPDDERSLGQTVASSTYGEDRLKVVNQSLLDPYGDKGTYTGVVLRSTGMPHDLGRMIYEEDGRIYEGDWSVLCV